MSTDDPIFLTVNYFYQNGARRQVICVLDMLPGAGGGSDVYSVWVSYYEIYNECVYDLLENFTSHGKKQRTRLKLAEDRKGKFYPKGKSSKSFYENFLSNSLKSKI